MLSQAVQVRHCLRDHGTALTYLSWGARDGLHQGWGPCFGGLLFPSSFSLSFCFFSAPGLLGASLTCGQGQKRRDVLVDLSGVGASLWRLWGFSGPIGLPCTPAQGFLRLGPEGCVFCAGPQTCF